MANKRICPSCGSEIQDNADYCVMCGDKYDESLPAFTPAAETEKATNMSDSLVQGYALKLLRRSRLLGFLLILCLALLAAAGFYIYNGVQRSAAYEAELSSLQSENGTLRSENEALADINTALGEEREALKNEIERLTGSDDYAALKLEYFDEIIAFLNEHGGDNLKFDDYGADRDIVVLHAGEAALLKVHFDYEDSILYHSLEKDGIISLEWSTAWVGTSCPVTISGLKPGTCLIRFGSDYSEDVFYVLCVVLP